MTVSKRRPCPVCHRIMDPGQRCYRHFSPPQRRNYELTAQQAYAISHCYACGAALCLDPKQHLDGAVCHNAECRKYVAKTDEETQRANAIS